MISIIICFGVIEIFIVGGISSGLFAFNFLIILILNRKCIFRCGDSKESKVNINNKAFINDQPITTPMINEAEKFKINDIGRPIENKNGIGLYKNNNAMFEQKPNNYNEMLNLPVDDQISQTPNSRVSDLSNAPLPADVDLPSENEIYNYSNL